MDSTTSLGGLPESTSRLGEPTNGLPEPTSGLQELTSGLHELTSGLHDLTSGLQESTSRLHESTGGLRGCAATHTGGSKPLSPAGFNSRSSRQHHDGRIVDVDQSERKNGRGDDVQRS